MSPNQKNSLFHSKIVDSKKEKILTSNAEKFIKDSKFGASIYFLGTVRNINDNKKVTGITYDSHDEMVIKSFKEIYNEADQKLNIKDIKNDKIADKHASLDKEAQDAITDYRPVAKTELPIAMGKFSTTRYCMVELKPLTGRKHQLRRHMAHLRHPIIGDTSHGDGKHNKLFRHEFDSHRLLLHASSLSFIHPFTDESLVINAGFDSTWERLAEVFGWPLLSK